MDTTFRGWSTTSAAMVRLVISRRVLIFALPLGFHGRVRVVRSMYLLAALHGIEASLLASESLRKLRSSIRRVFWSRRQPLAGVGAVLSLLGGPPGCAPAFCVVWFRFRLLRRYLALWPTEVGRVYRLLEMVSEGIPGHGPIHLLSASAAEIGFRWDPLALAWTSQVFLRFVMWLALCSILRQLFLMLGITRLQPISVVGKVFGADLCWMYMAPCSSLILLTLEKEVRLCFVASWLGEGGERGRGVWNGVLLGRVSGQVVPCRFCGAPDGDGHLFWECTFPLLVDVRENREFHDLMREDKAHWRDVCFGMAGFLSCLAFLAPPFGQPVRLRVLVTLLTLRLGVSYSSGMVAEWSPPDEFDGVEAASLIPDHPNVWTDGSLVLDQFTGVSSSGAVFLLTSQIATGEIGGGVMLIVFALKVLFFFLAGVSAPSLGLFSLFKELKCGVSFWLCSPLVRFILGLTTWVSFVMLVGRLLDGSHGSPPFELVNDGDLLLLLHRMLHLRGLDTVRIKGHADDAMVLDGQVREDDTLGDDAADLAADFGRRRVGNAVIDARRNLSGICGRWYPVLLDLHRFFMAISRAVVNHDGRDGTAPDPLVWSAGALSKRRRLDHAVRDRFFLPGPGIWDSEWVTIPASVICAEDVAFLALYHWSLG